MGECRQESAGWAKGWEAASVAAADRPAQGVVCRFAWRGLAVCVVGGDRREAIWPTLQLLDVVIDERLLRTQALQQVRWQREQLTGEAPQIQQAESWCGLVIHLHSAGSAPGPQGLC